jgi:hypothetical protein
MGVNKNKATPEANNLEVIVDVSSVLEDVEVSIKFF